MQVGNALHGVVQGAVEEEGGSVAVRVRGAVDDAVRGRQEAFIGPALHHLAGVHDEAAIDHGRLNPLAGLGQHREAGEAGLRQERHEAGIRVGRYAELAGRGFMGRVVGAAEDILRLAESDFIEPVSRLRSRAVCIERQQAFAKRLQPRPCRQPWSAGSQAGRAGIRPLVRRAEALARNDIRVVLSPGPAS